MPSVRKKQAQGDKSESAHPAAWKFDEDGDIPKPSSSASTSGLPRLTARSR